MTSSNAEPLGVTGGVFTARTSIGADFERSRVGSRVIHTVTRYACPETRGRYECGTPAATDVCGSY